MAVPDHLLIVIAGYVLAAVSTITLTAYVIRWHQNGPAERAFGVFVGAIALAVSAFTVRLFATSLQAKAIWELLAYAGLVLIPAAFIVFVLRFTGRHKWVSRPALALLTVHPLFTMVMLATNRTHGLFYEGVSLTQLGDLSLLVWTAANAGPVFWIHLVYTYSLFFLGTVLLVRFALKSNELYRSQSGAIVVGTLVPWVVNVAVVSGVGPEYIDLTPLGFALSASILAVGVFRFKLLDIVPIARQAVVESMDDAVFVLDKKGRIVETNPAARDSPLLSPEIDDPVGKPFQSVLRDELADEPILGDETNKWSLRIDGEQLYFWARKIPITQPGGENATLLTVTDVTGRRRREQEIQDLSERLELAVEGANIGIWDWDMQTDEVERDELHTEMLGYTPEEMGDHLNDFERLVHPEGKTRHDKALAEHIENQTPHYQCEYRLKTASGDWKWVRTIGKVVERDKDGDPVRAVGIHLDINDRKEREQELRREKERLDEFASVVSHDLRNPLNVAQGRVDLAGEECDTEHLDPAADGIKRALALIEDMLALARGGQEVGDMEPVNATELADACWDTVETADATVVADLESTIRADRTRLRQLLENLFRNAVEHGADDVTVRIGSLPDGFYVEDDGPGIPEGKREDVWEAGYSRTEEGTGLGLSIIQQIVEAHGWNIRITEGSDGGARFEITGVEVIAE